MSYFTKISSKDNEIVKLASKLVSSAKTRRENKLFVLDGLRLCRDAALNGFPIKYFIVSDSALEKFSDDAGFIAEKAEKSISVPDHIILKISDTVNPQGFISICEMKSTDVFEFNADGKYIALENLADPSNLGAISRSAEAFAFDGIIIDKNGCDPYNPKALRASMGALLRIPVIICENFTETIKKSDLVTYAAVIDKDATPINRISFKTGSIALIGNEANGLTKETVAVCDSKVTIPMTGKAESLNAATAAAIIMWEMSR